MGSLTISHNFAGETGYIIAVPKKSTAPLADVICTIDGVASQTRKAYPAPHSQRSMLIEHLDPVWYLIKFYRSVDGLALDEEILTLAGNALTGSIYPITKYEYVVNRGESGTDPDWSDPITDDTGIRDERLAGQVYWIEERGTGTLLAAEITDRTDDGGGFDFADAEKKMNDGGVYFANVIERVDANPVSSGSSSDFNDVVILTADTDFDPNEHGGKVLVADFLSDIGILSLPNLSLIPDCKFRLTTHGGTQSFVGIQLDAGDIVEFRKSDLNVIWLGSGEEIEVLFKDNVMYVTRAPDGYGQVGQRIWGDVLTELNAIPRDGTQYNQSELPRLVQWIDEYGVPVVSEGTGVNEWNYSVVSDGETIYPNRGKFAKDDVNGKIRVPDDRDRTLASLKYTDGTTDSERSSQGAGGFQQNKFKEHYHEGGTETHDTPKFRRGSAHSLRAWSGTVTTNFPATTDDASDGGGTKTRMDNTGMMPLLKV